MVSLNHENQVILISFHDHPRKGYSVLFSLLDSSDSYTCINLHGIVEFLNSSYIMNNFIKHEEFTHTVSLCIFKYLQFVIPNKYVIGGAGFLDFNIV